MRNTLVRDTAVFASCLLLVVAVGCKKKVKNADTEASNHGTNVEDSFKGPVHDSGDPLSEDLRAITEKYLHRINFDFDRAEIRSDARPTLEQNAAFLNKYPTVKILIEGHCDERGSVEYNLALGERRAKAAQAYLATLGVSRDRMSTVSYGKEVPLQTDHDESAWEINRRDQFVAVAK